MPLLKTHENLHKNVNENMFSFTFLCKFSYICYFAILFGFSWNFHQNVELRNWEWYTPFGKFLLIFNWEGADVRPQSGLGKSLILECRFIVYWFFFKISFKKNSFMYTVSVKQIGSRTSLTFCLAWSGSRLFAKIISRRLKLPLAGKEWQDSLSWFCLC